MDPDQVLPCQQHKSQPCREDVEDVQGYRLIQASFAEELERALNWDRSVDGGHSHD